MEGWRHAELCGALEVRRGSGCMGTIVGGAAGRRAYARLPRSRGACVRERTIHTTIFWQGCTGTWWHVRAASNS